MSTETLESQLATLLGIAWLLPLAGFAVETFAGYWSHRLSKAAAYVAVGCIATGFLCSALALALWVSATGGEGLKRSHHAVAHASDAGDEHAEA